MYALFISTHILLPGYANGAEANCTSGLCCRDNAYNSHSPQTPLLPAPRYGSFLWLELAFTGRKQSDVF
jgi:hypothetical protein